VKQVVQNLRGEVRVTDVPPPALRPGGVLVRTVCSVVSPGTERSNVAQSRRSLLVRARERPDLVRQVLDRVRREGLAATFRSVNDRLDALIAMGYSSAGIVEAVGEGAEGFRVGDRVACGGGGFASHAELVWVPKLLCARVPEYAPGVGPADGDRGVGLPDAAFTTLGAIALQGVRQAEVRLGETVVVLGLGLLGLLTVQLARSAGCHVIAADLDPDRVRLATGLGADVAVLAGADLAPAVSQFTAGRGADAVIITAATESQEPVRQAGVLSRDRGRVVIVGAVPADIPRTPYYEKEIEVRFSRSYGPGRYDVAYEEQGHDYPIGYVRWTEQRNMEAFLDLLAQGRVSVVPLVTHRFAFADAVQAYELLTRGSEPSLAILLEYPDAPDRRTRIATLGGPSAPTSGRVGIGLVGAGEFARAVLVPALRAVPEARLRGVATATGISATSLASQAGFEFATTELGELLKDPAIDAIVIATRHGLHASQAIAALRAGKHVFVEKPLCLTEADLLEIVRAWEGAGQPRLMVGFNRRLSPHTLRVHELLAGRRQPLAIHYRVNAGYIPPQHWVHDPVEGGGRILGEGCHFVDLASALVGAPAVRVSAEAVSPDGAVALLSYPDGSVATVAYVSGGHPKVEKERIEVIGAGVVATINDFVTTAWHAPGGEGRLVPGGQDKGHRAGIAAFVRSVLAGTDDPRLTTADCIQSTLATLRLRDAAAGGVGLAIERHPLAERGRQAES